MSKRGLLVVVSGPSGTGKGTVCAALRERLPQLAYSVSATTRPPRPGEVDGEDYYFLPKTEFERMIAIGGLLEYAEVFGNYYGTPLRMVQNRTRAGQDILLEIDTRGAMQVIDKVPEAVTIFLMPPSLEELERRLRGRGTETEASIARRLGEANRELRTARRYKYAVLNDSVDKAVDEIVAILDGEHHRADTD